MFGLFKRHKHSDEEKQYVVEIKAQFVVYDTSSKSAEQQVHTELAKLSTTEILILSSQLMVPQIPESEIMEDDHE